MAMKPQTLPSAAQLNLASMPFTVPTPLRNGLSRRTSFSNYAPVAVPPEATRSAPHEAADEEKEDESEGQSLKSWQDFLRQVEHWIFPRCDQPRGFLAPDDMFLCTETLLAPDDMVLFIEDSFAVEDLHYSTADFDPSAMGMKLQLASALGLDQTARMEAMRGNVGGQNFGAWTFSDGSQSFILKAVRCQRHHAAIPTETENFLALAGEYPSLVHDEDLAFPVRIFRCCGPRGNNTINLIAMRKALGECFTNIINMKCYARQIPQLMDTFEAAGHFIANLHNKYGLKHGDCQPSNIFLDEASGKFTMIDVSDLSPRGVAHGVTETDVDHFCGGVQLITRCHGDQISSQAVQRFKAGYMKCRPAYM
jgi:hypothetical protein